MLYIFKGYGVVGSLLLQCLIIIEETNSVFLLFVSLMQYYKYLDYIYFVSI